ncbi:MAG: putative Phosphatidylinositol 3,4,5-trisphosphate 3-phosphatase [Streblomastix strix]|uniref:Phosphatidylinositol 3,4,5-trisphosphate 3-phosphatase and dual-specificity protein phosphatase PTEN n=1 Tax=Streblomastix strix TaxID=222440 RepID=A0A5J4X6Z3_9EUKA|nr:MAG: putative Phosphatidylinositol 3,4,5-trisphosphate 3-phosphatase [Streblomastix strix]
MIRRWVSLEKRRFKNKDLNMELDLAYITPRIIAMGFPAIKGETIWRNPLSDVLKFLDTHHKDHYKVYNLCCEPDRQYDHSIFYGRVAVYPFADHNCPPFDMITQFCIDAEKYLKEDERNIICVHCKAGKGRTGLMICNYLLHTRQYATADKCIRYYGYARTKNMKGLTIPSQIRYVMYFEQSLYQAHTIPPAQRLILKKFTMNPCPVFDKGGCKPRLVILKEDIPIYNHIEEHPVLTRFYSKDGALTVEVSKKDGSPVILSGDVKMVIWHKKRNMMQFTINTRFVRQPLLVLQKFELDKAVSDKKHKLFAADFKLTLEFEKIKKDDKQKQKEKERKEKEIQKDERKDGSNSNQKDNEKISYFKQRNE